MDISSIAAVPSRFDWSHKAKGIPTYLKPNAQNLIAVLQLTCVILQSIYCPIPETKKRGWSYFMYPEDEWKKLEGIVKDDGSDGNAVTDPVLINIDTVTTTLLNRKYVAAEITFNQFEAAKKVAIKILVDSYPSGDYLLDMQDDTGAITCEPREAWQHMWDTLTTRNQKDTAIVNAQALLRTEYDPEKPINTTLKIIQDAKFLLN